VRPGCKEPWASVGYMVGHRTVIQSERVREPGSVPADCILAHRARPPATSLNVWGYLTYAHRRTGQPVPLGNAQRLGLAKALLTTQVGCCWIAGQRPGPAGIVESAELLLNWTRRNRV